MTASCGATLAAQAGATTKELMARIGHTTPAMSMRYQIAAAERDAAIADRLSAMAGWTHTDDFSAKVGAPIAAVSILGIAIYFQNLTDREYARQAVCEAIAAEISPTPSRLQPGRSPKPSCRTFPYG